MKTKLRAWSMGLVRGPIALRIRLATLFGDWDFLPEVHLLSQRSQSRSSQGRTSRVQAAAPSIDSPALRPKTLALEHVRYVGIQTSEAQRLAVTGKLARVLSRILRDRASS